MKILIIYLILYELRVAKPTTRNEWIEGEEGPMHSATWFDRKTTLEEDRLWKESVAPLWLNGLVEHEKRLAGRSPRARVLARSGCSCESEYEIKDLGEGHYPRYLTASRCKPKTCQNKFHSCRVLHYMVYVLRQREATGHPTASRYPDSSGLLETPLPESLRQKWQLRPMSVAVACISTLDSR